jgi:hypothetical protein
VGKSTKSCKLVGTCRCAGRRHFGLLIPFGEAPKPVEVSELSEPSPQCIERTHAENTTHNGWPAQDSPRHVADMVAGSIPAGSIRGPPANLAVFDLRRLSLGAGSAVVRSRVRALLGSVRQVTTCPLRQLSNAYFSAAISATTLETRKRPVPPTAATPDATPE